MLRWDIEYSEKFDQDYQVLLKDIQADGHDTILKSKIKAHITSYRNQFQQFVDLSQQRGLNSKEGLLGEMRSTIHQSETLLNEVSEELEPVIATQTRNAKILYMVTSTIPIVLILGVAIFTVKSIVSPINRLKKRINKTRTEHDLTIRANMSGNNGVSEMAMSAVNKAKEASSALGAIANYVMIINQQTERVIKGTQQQSATADGIKTNISAIDIMAASASESSQQTRTASNLLKSKALQLQDVVGLFKI